MRLSVASLIKTTNYYPLLLIRTRRLIIIITAFMSYSCSLNKAILWRSIHDFHPPWVVHK
jgi:hypothetical protein